MIRAGQHKPLNLPGSVQVAARYGCGVLTLFDWLVLVAHVYTARTHARRGVMAGIHASMTRMRGLLMSYKLVLVL